MTTDQIRYLLTLPPEDIVRWYQAKGFRFSWNWQDTWQDANTRSFTVAKVMKLDIQQEIKNNVDKIFTEGLSEEQFRWNLETHLKYLGWWGKKRADEVPGYNPATDGPPDKIVQLGSPHRLKTIYTVNANVAYSAGNYNFDIQNVASRPLWQYIQIDRPTKRKSHVPFADKVFWWHDPIWNTIYPPNGWYCGCTVRARTEAEVKALGLVIQNSSVIDKIDYMELALKNIPEEWQYNPAKEYASWQPDLSGYDDDIRKQY